MIRGYANGYTAHWIDMHPNREVYRGIRNGYRSISNDYDIVAFPDEQIVLLHPHGVVVIFLVSLDDLDRIEQKMHLVRTVEYPNMQLPPLNNEED